MLMITRPREDAEPLAAQLKALGIETIIEPLLSIELLDTGIGDLQGIQALLLTSANGVRALAANTPVRHVPVYSVGEATMRAAQQAGFEDVSSAAGDVQSLAELVGRKLEPRGGGLVHVAGTRVAGDLGGLLGRAGFDYRRLQLYHASKTTSLSPGAISALGDGSLEGVILYSPRTAQSFVQLITKAGLQQTTGGLRAFCLSQAVADSAGLCDWAEMIVATTPDQAAMIKSIHELTPQ